MLPESNYEEARPNIKRYTTLEPWALQSRKLTGGPEWAEFYVVRNRKPPWVVVAALPGHSIEESIWWTVYYYKESNNAVEIF